MYSEEDLNAAVEAGIFTEEAVRAFRDHVAHAASAPIVDEEHFRLISGFNDIFVVIASVLMLIAVAWIGITVTPWLGALASAITAWGLAEFFTRRRRMALPSIVLLLAFVGSVFGTGVLLLGSDTGTILASALAAAAAWLHWRRFRVPITVAAGTAAAVAFAIALVFKTVPAARDLTTLIALIAGLAVFALAMRWDAADPGRQTRKSDVAFWLHLLAAPLLVHPVFTALDVRGGQVGMEQALTVILLYVVIALVSLAIDRRALMVSALAYVLYAFSALLQQLGVVSLGFAITALAIGSALLLLSAFWHPCRTFVLGLFPEAVKRRLPPLQ